MVRPSQLFLLDNCISKTTDVFACLHIRQKQTTQSSGSCCLKAPAVSLRLPVLQAGQLHPGASAFALLGTADCSVLCPWSFPCLGHQSLSLPQGQLCFTEVLHLAEPDWEFVRKRSRKGLTRVLPRKNVWVHDWLCLLYKPSLLSNFITSGFIICLIARFPPRLISCYKYLLPFLCISNS